MIRPIDLQAAILSPQAPQVQRAEAAPRIDAQAAQAAFAAELTRREESVASAAEVSGEKIEANARKHDRERARKRKPRTPFEQVVDEAAGASEEAPHIVDFTA